MESYVTCKKNIRPDKVKKKSTFGLSLFLVHYQHVFQVNDLENPLFKMCVYMLKCTNKFFRTIRQQGVLMEGDCCTIARTAGVEMNVPRSII